MSVRWKPMILLSALFVVIAAMGLLAITSTLVQSSAEEILVQARAEFQEGKFDRSKIQYERALQREPRNAAIHAELAGMLAQWSEKNPELRAKLRPLWINQLVEAAKYGKALPGPRRALLADAIEREESGEGLYWARELKPLEPKNADACYVLAAEALGQEPARVAEAKPELAILQDQEPDRARTLWLRARLAEETQDDAELDRLIEAFRDSRAATNPVDQLARLRLRLIDLKRAEDPDRLKARVEAFRKELEPIAIDAAAPGRIRQVSLLLEQARKHLAIAATRMPSEKAPIEALGKALEAVADATYTKAIEATGKTDLRPYLAFAESLMARGQGDRCLQVVARALRTPLASEAAWLPTSMELREVAIKAALANPDDPKRFEKAAPYIKEMLASTNARYQALGHLFQGVIDLERSHLAEAVSEGADRPAVAKLGNSALNHLKTAALGLKDVPTAQALYGVALILSREPALGRQYLQDAQRRGAGTLDPRYQVWAAWSVLQAGYPEEAEPIVDQLLRRIERRELSNEYAATLHMLKGEIHQARQTPEQLQLARAEYQKAIEAGQALTPAHKLRMAQLDALLGESDEAMAEINALSQSADTGPAAEQLAILTLREQGRNEEAVRRLTAARRRFPDSADLVGLEAAMRLDVQQAEPADRLLAGFLANHPDNMELAMLRARILAGPLDRDDEARKLLNAIAEKSESSAPLVQLALLDLSRKDYDAVDRTIAKIRDRWSEAAAADLLDAQLAFARGNPQASASHLDAALKKDPNNKVALFWKAQLDDLTGSGVEAQRIFEAIVRDRPVKELDTGLPLTAAAQWALASRALEKQDYDGAISRFEALLRDQGAAELDRPARWKLALARAARGEVDQAKAEIQALLADPQTSPDERVQAADFFRNHGDPTAAEQQLDLVLKAVPNHPGAVAYRALTWASQDKAAQATALIRQALADGSKPAGLYLLLAAIENRDGAAGQSRAAAALDEGLKLYPDSAELLRARYELMVEARDPEALAFVEAFAREHPKGPARLVLVAVYRERGQFEPAKAALRDLLQEQPEDAPGTARLAAQLIELVLAQAARDAAADNREGEQERFQEASTLIAQYREQFPRDLNFPRFECELAARSGDLDRAKRLARELTAMDPTSPIGPLLTARLALASNRPRESVPAFEQALERSPTRDDIRLELGRALLNLGKNDDAVKQASAVLEDENGSPQAVLLKARALATQEGTPEAVGQARDEAARLLVSAIQSRPDFVEAYHLLADVQVAQKRYDQAIATLRSCVKRIPADDAGLSLLVQRLSEPRGESPPSARDLAEAKAIADRIGSSDEQGTFCLALAVGFHKAGQSELALPWAEKAASLLERPIVHLTCGDILLSMAEATRDPALAKETFQKAVAAYDRALEEQPDSVEAVNNKAWILHRYLDQNAAALQLAEGLLQKTDPETLPAEFFDTLGAIQAAVGKSDDAEKSFAEGLRKVPDHPILNFHMGRLLASRPDQARQARRYLEKARDARQTLPLAMAEEVDDLLARVDR